MTNREFSDEFSTLLNSFGTLPNITLDEYEKSVFLTKAQEQLVIDIYSGKNPFGDSFEKTEEIRRYLNQLVKTYETTTKLTQVVGLSKDSVFFQLPSEVWFITYESATLEDPKLGCADGITASVVPTLQDDYYKIKDNPFRGPGKTRVLRFDTTSNIMELISHYNISRYLVRYLVEPTPIVLTNLPDGLSINHVVTESECELNPVLHRVILERAVQMALVSRTQLTGNK